MSRPESLYGFFFFFFSLFLVVGWGRKGTFLFGVTVWLSLLCASNLCSSKKEGRKESDSLCLFIWSKKPESHPRIFPPPPQSLAFSEMLMISPVSKTSCSLTLSFVCLFFSSRLSAHCKALLSP